MSIFTKALSLITGAPAAPAAIKKGRYTERQLIDMESRIGREVFGPVPATNRREFFCLDEHTWVWHEEWIDVETGQRRMTTTRYEINDSGVLKVVGHTYRFIDGQELESFKNAVAIYSTRVAKEIYRRDIYTGQPLAAS